jgi:hypothetical protein
MKKQLALVVVGLFVTLSALSQNNPVTVKITFKNNSLLFREYTFITYSPGATENGTYGDFLRPGGTKEFTVAVGTRFYLADSKEKDLVMSGQKLSGVPFYTATLADNGKTIHLRKD